MSDIVKSGSRDSSTVRPDHHAEVKTLKSWFRQNAISIIITAFVIVMICVYLDPIDTLKVVLGLGLVIFIHELGHFLAAKVCDVHVKTFSIGFGPAVPFCAYKWGETTYMIGIIPLGGYVSMVGEGDTSAEEEGEEDPRSFKNKSVSQRMLIISAGVIMNVLLGMVCFMAAYMHGVEEKPAIVGAVESGSAAWRAGIHSDSIIERIESRENPVFNDISPIVMSTAQGETVQLVVNYQGNQKTYDIEPIRDEGVYFPQLGIASSQRLVLLKSRRSTFPPTIPASPASKTDPPFLPGDRVIAMSDPRNPEGVTRLAEDPQDPSRSAFADYHRRMVLLADRPITFQVIRAQSTESENPIAITVPPAPRWDLGMRMQMGKVVAVRQDSPAWKSGVQARPVSGHPSEGDRIAAVSVVQPNGKRLWYANGGRPPEADPADDLQPLDPLRLPLQLDSWAYADPPLSERPDTQRQVTLVVLRNVGHAEKRITLPPLDYDITYRFDRERVVNQNSPLPIAELGLAYWVNAVVDDLPRSADGSQSPAETAGIHKGDLIESVRLYATKQDGTVTPGNWINIKPQQWAAVDFLFQGQHPPKMGMKIKRNEETIELEVTAQPDPEFFLDHRGLLFQEDYRIQKADTMWDALALGVYRTLRFIRVVYLNLYAMASGRVSPKTMSGPLTIATVSYRIAGENFWQFLLFLGMISVNLAVVNFLPIPVLDGGHMVFLLLEKILGRPVPERVFAIAMYVGLALILALMIYVIRLDILRLFFGVN